MSDTGTEKLNEAGAAQENEAAAEKPTLGFQDVLALQDKVVEQLTTCYDPEIPVNIYELGLVYEVKVNPQGEAYVKMTLTSPACPVAGSLPQEVETKVRSVPGITGAKVEVVWDPPWDMSKMSERAKLNLGFL